MGSKSIMFMVYVFFLIATVQAGSSRPGVFNVKNYGAVNNAAKDNAPAFLKAWTEACAAPGAYVKVLVPKGTFGLGPVIFNGPCKAKMIHFEVKGTLKASTDLNKFKTDGWVAFYEITGFKLSGGGVFDGQGTSAWPYNKCPLKKHCKLLPHSIRFDKLTNARISGITSLNSKMFHMNINLCKDIALDSITIIAPDLSPNTDGIHMGNSVGVNITNSNIGTGDDCISVGSGTHKLYVKGITCGPGHGLSIGSLGRYDWEEDVSDITVTNCTLKGTTNGLRIKTWEESPKETKVSNLVFTNIKLINVLNGVLVDQEYCPFVSCSKKAPSKVKLTNVLFDKISGTSASKEAIKIICSKSRPCEGVKLGDIHLTYSGTAVGKDGVLTSTCSNAHITSIGKQTPGACK
ncbi:hypothetical protein GIB67_014134 [Kingdonia uniflora]|uniref:Exopolygalacturonase n=1 Tax=Kingdonia uniflora TaxID=39325 RepID=A0A7J7N4H2_9MAGN|nr:hypothetical protein GIB67_014134 [Kingdonia uniflora]